MADYKEVLLEADTIYTHRGADIKVLDKVKEARVPLQKEMDYSSNDPKVGVRYLVHYPTSEENSVIGVELAIGITKMDDEWTQRNLYPNKDPLEVFSVTEFGPDILYKAKLGDGAYIHFSDFALVIGHDGDKDFDKTFALLVEKQRGQQPKSISIANQGVEAEFLKEEGKTIEDLALTTSEFREAIRLDVMNTLKLRREQLGGYQDIGVAVMPGSMDAGGLVVAEIDYNELKKLYAQGSDWKKPMIIPTSELSDLLRSGDVQVNSLLTESALGKVIHNYSKFGDLYEAALSNSF